MKWKNFPTWLKGGIIGVIIGILIVLGLYFYNELSYKPVFRALFIAPIPKILNPPTLLIFFIYLIICFLIGAFLGWIIGKIKSKKRRK